VEPALSPERIDPNRPPNDWPASIPLIQAVVDHPRLVVLGDPGSGKSTLAAWLVLSLLSREKNRLKGAIGPLVPVPLVIRDLGINYDITWGDLLDRFIGHSVGQALGDRSQLERIFARGQAMVVVDGLDEAGGTPVRKAMVKALTEGFRRYPSVRWVITSRVVGYEEAPVNTTEYVGPPGLDLASYEQNGTFYGLRLVNSAAPIIVPTMGVAWSSRLFVSPFDDERINMFVRNWHEQHETDRAERPIRSRELLEAIVRSPYVQGLARVPNLLTMIALVYRVYLRLPDGRALLYERIAQAYLETIETARMLPTPGHALEDMKRWLGYAAFQMQRARFGEPGGTVDGPSKEQGILVSRGTLTDWIVFAMARGDLAAVAQQRATAEAFVDWVARRAGLIIPRAENLFAFAHLSFQEYFAAWFIAEQVTGPAWNRPKRRPSPLALGTELTSLTAACHDVHWHETLVLLFELLAVRGDWPDEILEQLLSPADDLLWFKYWNPPSKSENAATLAPSAPFSDDFVREVLLALLARDVHSGLSLESRRMAFWRVWRSVDSAFESMWKTNLFHPLGATEQLLQPDGGPPLALQVLIDPPRPLSLHAVFVTSGPTDGLVEALASSASAKTLAVLILVNISMADRVSVSDQLSDRGVAALANPAAGFSALAELHVLDTKVTDRGLMELSRLDTGLKALTGLSIGGTQITDAGVEEISRPETGLKSLARLSIRSIQVTNASLKALARRGSGLQALRSLDVTSPRITDVGLAELARRASGLKGLISLGVHSPLITDAGLRELAHAESALNTLQYLDLQYTNVTEHGIEMLREARPQIKITSSLSVLSRRNPLQ